MTGKRKKVCNMKQKYLYEDDNYGKMRISNRV